MRVGLVYQTFDLSGSLPRAHVELTRYLVRAGHEVHVFSSAAVTDRSLAPGAHFHDVATIPAGGRYRAAGNAVAFAWNSTRAVARHRPALDVVHGRGMSTIHQDIVHLPGVLRGQPEVEPGLTAHERFPFERRLKELATPLTRPIEPVRNLLESQVFASPRLSRIHVDSRLVRDDLLEHYSVDEAAVVVVPTGVNLEEFEPVADRRSLRLELELPPDETLILFCGHDFRRKGLDRAILALGAMTERATLVVIGGRDPSQYERLAREAGVAERVLFVGGRTDAARFFQASDIVTLPTRMDMWGAPVIEAMASGVPIVTSDAAGASDAVVDGESGFVLAEPVEPDALAAALDRLVADPELRARMGARGLELARPHSWDGYGATVEQELLALAERRGLQRNGSG